MRKFLLILATLVVVLLALAVAAAAWTVHEFADPNSRASLAFKDRFEGECVTTANRAGNGDTSLTSEQQADLAAVCTCGADQMRDDIAATGLIGFARLLAVEGIDAKIQRVLDSCQTTPSEP